MFNLSIRKELFWDVDPTHLDQVKNKRLIIDRIISYGNLSELLEILNYYGKDTVVEEIKKLGYLDPKTLEFVITFFEIRKEELQCFTKKQSAKAHWN
jgi:hypothetical protein